MPRFLTAFENGWQGGPATYTSTFGSREMTLSSMKPRFVASLSEQNSKSNGTPKVLSGNVSDARSQQSEASVTTRFGLQYWLDVADVDVKLGARVASFLRYLWCVLDCTSATN